MTQLLNKVYLKRQNNENGPAPRFSQGSERNLQPVEGLRSEGEVNLSLRISLCQFLYYFNSPV